MIKVELVWIFPGWRRHLVMRYSFLHVYKYNKNTLVTWIEKDIRKSLIDTCYWHKLRQMTSYYILKLLWEASLRHLTIQPTSIKMRVLCVCLLLAVGILYVEAHGRLWEPPGRGTEWRRDEFKDQVPWDKQDYNDMELWCGGRGVSWRILINIQMKIFRPPKQNGSVASWSVMVSHVTSWVVKMEVQNSIDLSTTDINTIVVFYMMMLCEDDSCGAKIQAMLMTLWEE